MNPVTFTIPGKPGAKQRARFVRTTGRAYTPEPTARYENLVRMCAAQAMVGRGLFVGPVSLVVAAVFEHPKSWSKKRRAGAAWHESKPDGSNVLKSVEDALNGVCWVDDSQVALATVEKRYGTPARVEILVRALEAHDANA